MQPVDRMVAGLVDRKVAGLVDRKVAGLVDLLVTGRILTMDAARRDIPDGAVAVSGSRIVAVGTIEELADFEPTRRIAGGVIMPGMIDCHTHVTQALVRGLIADELPMIYRLYTPATTAMTPEECGLAATLCCSQLLRSGVTTVCEGAIGGNEDQSDAVIDAIASTGIRCNLVRGRPDQDAHHAALYSQTTDRSWCRPRPGALDVEMDRIAALLARFPPGTDALMTAGVCASSLLSCSPDYFAAADALARKACAKLHVHAARDREEVEFCLSVYGRRPIEQLAELGVIGPHLVVAHAMLANAAELRLLAGAGVAHSPIECVNILSAIPDVRMMRELGVTVGLGCDNAANDMFRVMLAAWLIHGATRGIAGYEPAILPAIDILSMATIEAARLLGLDAVTGSIEPGKQADLVVLDANRPIQHLPTELVRYGATVRTVLVAGRVVFGDGALSTIDAEKLGIEADKAAARLRAIVEPRRYRSLCC
jgi:cytosine/adenosine deaminase-related metal-dependent hydrolase